MGLKNKLTKNKNLLAFLLFVLFWFSFTLISGTLQSGFHFTDNHGIISTDKQLQDTGFYMTCQNTIESDFKIRFRPFYFFHHVIEVKLLGVNFTLWAFYNVLLAIFCSYFLYLFAERQGYHFFPSLLFPFLTLIGYQFAIWFKIGPAETIGFFLLSASLFFLANSIFKEKKHHLVISFLLLVLSSLSKESFTVFIPAYLVLLLWLKKQKQPSFSIIDLIKSNTFIIIFCLIVLSFEVYAIVFLVGTNKIGYAGVDDHVSLIQIIKFILQQFRIGRFYVFLIIFGIFLLLQSFKQFQLKTFIDFSKNAPYLFAFTLSLAIAFPQFVLYTKSGMYERYLLPFTLSYSILIIFLLQKIYEEKLINSFTKISYSLLIVFGISHSFKKEVWSSARTFALEGKETGYFLSTIEASSRPNDSILIVLDPFQNYEWGYSIDTYLTEIASKKNVFFLNNQTAYNNQNAFSLELIKDFENKFAAKLVSKIDDNFSCIAVFPFKGNKEVKNCLDSMSNYHRAYTGNFINFEVYSKKIIPF